MNIRTHEDDKELNCYRFDPILPYIIESDNDNILIDGKKKIEINEVSLNYYNDSKFKMTVTESFSDKETIYVKVRGTNQIIGKLTVYSKDITINYVDLVYVKTNLDKEYPVIDKNALLNYLNVNSLNLLGFQCVLSYDTLDLSNSEFEDRQSTSTRFLNTALEKWICDPNFNINHDVFFITNYRTSDAAGKHFIGKIGGAVFLQSQSHLLSCVAHEFGHGLGLKHVFSQGGLNQDAPFKKQARSAIETNNNEKSGNFMDYVNDPDTSEILITKRKNWFFYQYKKATIDGRTLDDFLKKQA